MEADAQGAVVRGGNPDSTFNAFAGPKELLEKKDRQQ
jgi:hypothetical protein